MKVINQFELDISDLPATSERRVFSILGDKGAEFKLEIKDNTTGYYYNFVTNVFQVASSSLEEKVPGNSYKGTIRFPAVTGGSDQYDVYLYAKPGTEHTTYNEVKFKDGSLDINSSTGSNSLMMQKVIYQYTALTLTLTGYSPNSTVTGTLGDDTISINKGRSQGKTAFGFKFSADATAAYRLLKQPVASDILSFVEPVIGAAPTLIEGENIYPTITTAADSTVDGGTTVDGASSGTTVTTHVVSSTIATVGDRVLGNTALAAATVTVETVSGANTFTISEAISIADDLPLSFSNRMNYRWPINNLADILLEDMIVFPATNVTTDSSVAKYQDTIVEFEGTKHERTIVKKEIPAIDTLGLRPTVLKGTITVQPGAIVFDKQQPLALASDTVQIGGYGEDEILRVYGWDVRFTDLAITLTAPTTTTTEATSAHATIAVADVEGVINNVSRVGGIGVDPALQNPLITSGGGADGSGDWIMDAVQTLENGVTLTIENTGRIASITGKIEIVKAGTASQTLRFDIEKLLSMSA